MQRQSGQPIEAHAGSVELHHSFQKVNDWLREKGATLNTEAGTAFQARSAIARDGRPVLRFFQNNREYARAYECCWGRYVNCNRTLIGMYCKALDDAL